MAETSLPVLSAASVTTNVLAFALANGTIVMQSIPTNVSGTALVGQGLMATSIPVVVASDQNGALGSSNIAQVFATSTAFTVVGVKSAPGVLNGLSLSCPNSTNAVFLKVYNVTAASVTSASSPAGIYMVPSGGVNNPYLPIGGVAFTTAISYVVTKLATTTDTTAVQSGDVVGAIYFV